MRFYWLKDCIEQKQFNVYWKPGNQTLADYITKHHPPTHHKIMRTKCLLHLLNSIATMRGCVNPVPAQTSTNGHGTVTWHRIRAQNVPIHGCDRAAISQNGNLIS